MRDGAVHSVLLVGGSSEIGSAITAVLLGQPPGRAVLAGRPSRELTDAATRLRIAGHEAHLIPYDASWDTDRTTEMIDRAWGADGVDAVVLAVGCMGPAVPTDSPQTAVSSGLAPVAEAGLEVLIRTNLLGPALVANAAADRLAAQGRGALVVVTSAAAVHPRNEILGYSAAKQALDTLARGLDHRLRPFGARCLVVRPGRVSTRMSAGLASVPLTTDPTHVATRVRAALATAAPVVWAPRLMKLATHGLRLAPTRLLPRSLR